MVVEQLSVVYQFEKMGELKLMLRGICGISARKKTL
jgi:hypothetical protein